MSLQTAVEGGHLAPAVSHHGPLLARPKVSIRETQEFFAAAVSREVLQLDVRSSATARRRLALFYEHLP
jgi:hypothetical protein